MQTGQPEQILAHLQQAELGFDYGAYGQTMAEGFEGVLQWPDPAGDA